MALCCGSVAGTRGETRTIRDNRSVERWTRSTVPLCIEWKIKVGFELLWIFLDCLGSDDYLLFFWFAKQQSVSLGGPCCRVLKVVAASFMLTATTAGRAVERNTKCHQGGSDMCPARAVPYGHRNQGTRRLPVPQRVHTKGKEAPRRPALLHNIFALN